MSDRKQRNLITLLKIFKNRPYHLSKYLLDNGAFSDTFLKKIEKSHKLDQISQKGDNIENNQDFKSISQMDDFYNSLLDEMTELVKTTQSKTNLSTELNQRLSKLISEEKYEEAAALRDYMIAIGIDRKNDNKK